LYSPLPLSPADEIEADQFQIFVTQQAHWLRSRGVGGCLLLAEPLAQFFHCCQDSLYIALSLKIFVSFPSRVHLNLQHWLVQKSKRPDGLATVNVGVVQVALKGGRHRLLDRVYGTRSDFESLLFLKGAENIFDDFL